MIWTQKFVFIICDKEREASLLHCFTFVLLILLQVVCVLLVKQVLFLAASLHVPVRQSVCLHRTKKNC